MNKSRNSPRLARAPHDVLNARAAAHPDPTHQLAAEQLGIGPLNARSVILSALLGTHPPVLPARALVALAELFGLRAGTARTALSRMVAAGELVTADGRYRLGGRLLERQRQQDVGRAEPGGTWNGSWFVAFAVGDRRTVAERRAFRAAMVGARMAELRPDIWLRPGNVEQPSSHPDVAVTTGPLDGVDPADMVARLWPLDDIDQHARRLLDALATARPTLETDGVDFLPQAFVVSAATVRFLRTEPQLPPALQPADWTPPTVRPAYDEFEHEFQVLLRHFFATVI